MPKASLIAALLFVAFAIDRVVAAMFFAGEYYRSENRDKANHKILYFLFSSMLAALAVGMFDALRILGTFWPETSRPDARIDAIVTWLVLVAGADRLASFIGDSKPAQGKPNELRVAGKLEVDDQSENVLRIQRQ